MNLDQHCSFLGGTSQFIWRRLVRATSAGFCCSWLLCAFCCQTWKLLTVDQFWVQGCGAIFKHCFLFKSMIMQLTALECPGHECNMLAPLVQCSRVSDTWSIMLYYKRKISSMDCREASYSSLSTVNAFRAFSYKENLVACNKNYILSKTLDIHFAWVCKHPDNSFEGSRILWRRKLFETAVFLDLGWWCQYHTETE